MSLPPAADVTGLLHAWRAGEDGALERLVPLVYDELRRVAHARMRGQQPGHSLQTTALVHEAYLRLVDARHHNWQNRTHFFALCSQAMRQILVDSARARGAAKRGGGGARVPFEDWLAASPPLDIDLLALDEALNQLAADDPRQGRVVELRYFGGLSVEETAEVLGVSPQTVMRDWSAAKLWLVRALRHAGDAAPGEPHGA
jgi:RNA polymerase sigma factor (TIGR02999 family)